jgi:hypothetical protein
MSAPETPSDSDPPPPGRGGGRSTVGRRSGAGGRPPPRPGGASSAHGGPASHASERPSGWIAVAGLLAARVIGLGIYALNLNSDIDDADAQIASQQEQMDEVQETAVDIVAFAQAAYDDLNDHLGAAQEGAG